MSARTRILSLLLLTACPGGDPSDPTDSETCTNGLRDGTALVTLTGPVNDVQTMNIVCGTNPDTPWQAQTMHIPAGLDVPPYTEISIQYDSDWAFRARFATDDLEPGTSTGVPRATDEPGPPLGHGWFAAPVQTDGYNHDLGGGTLEILSSELIEGPIDFVLITGTLEADFAGAGAQTAEVVLTDFPVALTL